MLNGYRTILKPEHSRAMHGSGFGGYVYEHILVAEKMLGRKLLKGEVIHHLDGNRSNNRMDNLIVLLNSQHAKLHGFLKKFPNHNGTLVSEKHEMQGVNSGNSKVVNLIYCPCGEILQKHQEMYCSNECRGLDNRKVTRPLKEELRKDIDSMSWLAIGRKYGVSDNAVRKWARKYGLL